MADFETYAEAKAYFDEQGIITKDKLACFSYPGDPIAADCTKHHDVMLCLFSSNLMYTLGCLRDRTMRLGYTLATLTDELHALFDDGHDKEDLARLLTGDFKVKQQQDEEGEDDGRIRLVVPPEMNFTDIETLILNKGKKFDQFNTGDFQQGIASELDVVGFQYFIMRKVLMYRFQAKHNKDQLVYGISVHCKDEFQDLILSFRGSSTVQDWLQNIQVPLVELLLRHDTGSNNAYLIEQRGYHAIEIHVELYNKLTRVLSLAGDAPLKIRVHAGMLEYLFSTNEGKSKHTMYAKIRDDLLALCNGNGDGVNGIDKIYVTGHSLGGGLATLAAFLLACDKSFSPETKMEKRKIQCIAFADPCVGNVGFQRAMAVLAHYKNDGSSSWQYPDPTSQKLKVRPGHVNSHCTLNYTRFQNDRDVVPMMFPLPSYRNTGIKVHLHKTWFGNPGRHLFSKFFGLYPNGGYTIYRDHPVMDDSATSFSKCFYHMAGPFAGLILTTIPVLVLVLCAIMYSLIQVVLSIMPCNADFFACSVAVSSFVLADPTLTTTMFATFAVAIAVEMLMGVIRLSRGEANKGEETFLKVLWGLKNQIEMFVIGIGLVFSELIPEVSSFFMTGPDATWHFNYLVAMAVFIGMVSWWRFAKQPMTQSNAVRILVLIVAVPSMLQGMLYLVNDAAYAFFIHHGAMGIAVGLILLQLVMLVRAPWDVYSARTHSLNDYYNNIRPHHPTLSRAKKILLKHIEEKKTK